MNARGFQAKAWESVSRLYCRKVPIVRKCDTFTLRTKHGSDIVACYIATRRHSDPVLLYSHGNAVDLGQMLPFYESAPHLLPHLALYFYLLDLKFVYARLREPSILPFFSSCESYFPFTSVLIVRSRHRDTQKSLDSAECHMKYWDFK